MVSGTSADSVNRYPIRTHDGHVLSANITSSNLLSAYLSLMRCDDLLQLSEKKMKTKSHSRSETFYQAENTQTGLSVK